MNAYMLQKVVFTFLTLLLVFPSLFLAAQPEGNTSQPQDETPKIKEAPPGGDFTLYSSDGPVSLSDFRGKVVLLYFGYTKCPDVCPISLSYLTHALNEMTEEELKNIQALFVSVDPKRDTYELLKEYAAFFHPNLTGITGSAEEVAKAAELYGAQYYEVELDGSAFGYAVNHSTVTYLTTPDGTLRFIFPHGTAPKVILEAARFVLAGN